MMDGCVQMPAIHHVMDTSYHMRHEKYGRSRNVYILNLMQNLNMFQFYAWLDTRIFKFESY